MLRHDREGEIVAVAALVIGLEVIPVHPYNSTIRQVAECAVDRVGARVADQGQRQALFQTVLCLATVSYPCAVVQLLWTGLLAMC